VLTLLIGVYLGVIYQQTGSLTVVIITHAVYDLVALVYLLRIREPQGMAEVERERVTENP
jgi:membrane protease YdiL (CAAX protease family)